LQSENVISSSLDSIQTTAEIQTTAANSILLAEIAETTNGAVMTSTGQLNTSLTFFALSGGQTNSIQTTAEIQTTAANSILLAEIAETTNGPVMTSTRQLNTSLTSFALSGGQTNSFIETFISSRTFQRPTVSSSEYSSTSNASMSLEPAIYSTDLISMSTVPTISPQSTLLSSLLSSSPVITLLNTSSSAFTSATSQQLSLFTASMERHFKRQQSL